MKNILWICGFVFCSFNTYSQNSLSAYPKVGNIIQDHTFTDLVNYPAKQLSIKEFRGKWLILDVWSRRCTGCVLTFPKMDKLSKQFKDKVQVILVAAHDGSKKHYNATATEEGLTKKVFNYEKEKHGLSLVNAFDSVFFAKFKCSGTPTIFIVNPEGIIAEKVISVDSADMEKLLAGQKPQLRYIPSKGEPALYEFYDRTLPLLTSGVVTSGGPDTLFMYRSLISPWHKGTPVYTTEGFIDVTYTNITDSSFTAVEKVNHKGKAQVFGCDLYELLRIAYFGQDSRNNNPEPDQKYEERDPEVIVELSNKNLFTERNEATGAGTYNYSLTIPDENSSLAKKLRYMRQDLERTFSFKSSIEKRNVPVFALITVDHQKVKKLKSTRKDKNIYLPTYGVQEQSFFNISTAMMGRSLSRRFKFDRNGNKSTTLPFYDETGIDYNIDITLTADFQELESLRAALRKHGLDLIQKTKSLDCIVVKDAEHN